jgi:hypothetical protein
MTDMEWEEKHAREHPWRFDTFVVSIAAASPPTDVTILFSYIDGEQDEATGLWTLDDDVCVARVVYSVIEHVHTYKRKLREGETHRDKTEKLPPTDAAYIAAGWEYVSAHEHIHHYVLDDGIGAMRDDLIESVPTIVRGFDGPVGGTDMKEFIDDARKDGQDQIEVWNERQAKTN